MENFTHDELQLLKYLLNDSIKRLNRKRSRCTSEEYQRIIDDSISIVKHLEKKLDDSIRDFRID